jgi:type IV pilus biogenesis protein PilP
MSTKRVAVLVVAGALSASAIAESETVTTGDISALMAENERLAQLIEQQRKRIELQQLELQLSGGVVPNQMGDGFQAGGFDGFGGDMMPRPGTQGGSRLPMISRLFGSNGNLSADLIYRNGDMVPGVKAGSMLPTGERVERVTMDEVVVAGKDGEQRLRFVPRHLSR